MARITSEHSGFQSLFFLNYQNLARHLVEAICINRSPAVTALRFASHWLSLSKIVQVPSDTKSNAQSYNIQHMREETELHDAEVWEFSEERFESWNEPYKLDIWVIPVIESCIEYPTDTIILSFHYCQPEFVDIAWLRAMKKLASRLGQTSYTPDELLVWYREALRTWEENVDRYPNNFMVSRLADAYAELGDLKLEIDGWCRLFGRHPTNFTIFRLLHRALSRSPVPYSLLSFLCLCILHLIERNREPNGLDSLEVSGSNASTSDKDPQLLQLSLIDSGAYGEVYAVRPISECPNSIDVQ